MKNYCQIVRRSDVVGGQLLGIALAVIAWTVPAGAAVVTLNPIADTMVVKSAASDSATYTNNGGGALLGGSIYNGTNRGEYSMMRFDFSSAIPAGSVISAVTLKMTAAFGYSYSNGEILRFSLMDSDNAGWVEGTSANTRLGATGAYENQTSYTSTTVNSGTAWASGGIFGVAPGDLGAQVGSQALSGVTAGTTYSFSLDPVAISSWLTDPTAANAGLVFYLTNNQVNPTAATYIYFHSMNASVASGLLPQMEITYTPIPEPAVFGLLITGGLAFMRLRGKRRLA